MSVKSGQVHDFALLSLEPSLREDFKPIHLTSYAQEADGFVSRGFTPLAGVDILTIFGTIRNLHATILGDVSAIQLFSYEAGAEMPLGGMSGAPVLVGSGTERESHFDSLNAWLRSKGQHTKATPYLTEGIRFTD